MQCLRIDEFFAVKMKVEKSQVMLFVFIFRLKCAEIEYFSKAGPFWLPQGVEFRSKHSEPFEISIAAAKSYRSHYTTPFN